MASVTSQDEKRVIDSAPHQLFIGGEWRGSHSGATLAIEDPSTGETLCEIADGTPEDAVAALDAACAVQDEWAATAPRDRGEILRRAYELMTERSEELGLLMTLEMGKPLAEAAGEITYAAEFIRWFSEEAVRIDGRYAVNPSGSGRP
jgi:succinate-semialdehyde dehydrogenase/glutarate-semialdehyde dehydrogenase